MHLCLLVSCNICLLLVLRESKEWTSFSAGIRLFTMSDLDGLINDEIYCRLRMVDARILSWVYGISSAELIASKEACS